jgi:hypothetical protein
MMWVKNKPHLPRVCGKKFFGGGRVWGVGCGVWGFTSFEVANYLIFREKVPKFPPDHSNGWHFLRKKSLKVLPNKVFRFIQPALPKYRKKRRYLSCSLS